MIEAISLSGDQQQLAMEVAQLALAAAVMTPKYPLRQDIEKRMADILTDRENLIVITRAVALKIVDDTEKSGPGTVLWGMVRAGQSLAREALGVVEVAESKASDRQNPTRDRGIILPACGVRMHAAFRSLGPIGLRDPDHKPFP